MISVTYQTLVPASLIIFCEEMGKLFGKVERNLYIALSRSEKINTLKSSYQKRYGINARQFNSVYASIKGKIASSKECLRRHIKELQLSIKGLNKSIIGKRNKLKKLYPCCGINGHKTLKKQLRWEIHQKQRRLSLKKHKLDLLKTKTSGIIFGSRKLFQAQHNKDANGYDNHSEWLDDWQQKRNSQFMLIGSSDETAGCQNCQLSTDGNIKIRVPQALFNQFDKYVFASRIQFNYGHQDIEYALLHGSALTWRFVKKDNGKWYAFVTVKRPEVPIQSRFSNGMIGIDLNPSVIGWAYSDKQGNLKARGQIKINLRDRSSHQVKATLGENIAHIVKLAYQGKCPITVEKLDFSVKRASMRESGVRYSRMLSSFAYSQFLSMLESRASTWGIQVIKVNPAYSSLIGLTKFLKLYGLSSDTAAALVLARRALYKSERPPARYARFLPEDRHRHAWSYWRMLHRKLSSFKRHSFYTGVANSRGEVNLYDEGKTRSYGKPSGASSGRRDSFPQVGSTARPAS
ncbi:MAG: IS200/IS605 family accessory protein TnpB-related protein [Cyanobacteria bacterium P01_D01_bin.50]